MDSTTARFTTLDPNLCRSKLVASYGNSDSSKLLRPLMVLIVKSVGNAKQTDSNKPLGNGTETIGKRVGLAF